MNYYQKIYDLLTEGWSTGGDAISTGMKIGLGKVNPNKSFTQRFNQENRIADKIKKRKNRSYKNTKYGDTEKGKFLGALRVSQTHKKYGDLRR